MIVGHPGVLEVWPGSLPGTHRRLSGSGSWKKGRSHPGSWMILPLPVNSTSQLARRIRATNVRGRHRLLVCFLLTLCLCSLLTLCLAILGHAETASPPCAARCRYWSCRV